MLFLIRQRSDDRAQSRKRLVDAHGLLGGCASGLRLRQALRAREVHERELANPGLAGRRVRGARDYGDDHVGAARVLVEVGGALATVAVAALDERLHVRGGVHRLGGQVLDVGAEERVLEDLVLLLAHVLLGRCEEVLDVLVVDLEDGERELRLMALLLALGNNLKKPLHGAVRETRIVLAALHGEGLARAGLAVGEDAHVEAVEHRGHEGLRVPEHVLLRAVRPVDGGELVLLLGGLLVVSVLDDDVHVIWHAHGDAVLAVHGELLLARRAHAAVDA
mmetsp:Transcript_4222/g.12251  ORF Transcript_4222/g.12251 Transcript_4222/m.12251 type:complete len:278 (+) Transcript_4222:524-1357(+)